MKHTNEVERIANDYKYLIVDGEFTIDDLEEALTTYGQKIKEEEREEIVSIPIIKEFIESTQDWYDALAPAFKKGKCIMCGRKIHKQKELCDTLKTLTLQDKEDV
jgi:hypothetical protein